MEFNALKKIYSELSNKYDLPNFEELVEDFDIGKIERDSGNILRDIRSVLMEKIIHYVRLMELMISPSQSTPVFMIFLKQIRTEDKEIINLVFKNFVVLELDSFKLDIYSNQDKEVLQINKIFDSWKEMKPNLKKLIEVMDRNWNSSQKKDNKNYFS